MLTILSVAYPLAPVGPDAAGGAEQVLHHLDVALTRAGHRSRVIATEDSVISGELLPIPAVPPNVKIDADVRGRVTAAVRARLAEATASADLVHLHGIDFAQYLPPPGPPVLATLHLPPSWYDQAALRPNRPHTTLNCVSSNQDAACPADTAPRATPIGNGVPTTVLGSSRHGVRRFALMVGRICPEKGQHLAIAACKAAEVPLLIAGPVFPYPDHQAFFERSIRPELGPGCRFIGPIGLERKRRLMSAAICVLIPSLAPETSSLVAMEAASCGAPVVAFRAGALPEVVRDGVTGYLVADAEEMAAAIGRTGAIDRNRCRDEAAASFDVGRMSDRYLALYRELIADTA